MSVVEFTDLRPLRNLSAPRPEAAPRRARRKAPAEEAMNDQQFVRHLDHLARLSAGGEAAESAEAWEIEEIVRRTGELRRRYLALYLDSARGRGLPTDQEVKELGRLREKAEEMERGMERLKQAILDGTVQVAGLRPR